MLYEKEREEEAIRIAKDFREKGKQTELVLRRRDVSLKEYIDSAQRNLCVSMMYLKRWNGIEMVNLLTGKSNRVATEIK